MKKITAIICFYAIFLLVLPSANAIILEKKIEIKDSKEQTCCFGTIYGYVAAETGGYPSFIPFAKIEIEGVRKKICGIFGSYRFIGLPLERTYDVTADANRYRSKTFSITLTNDDPCKELIFVLKEDPDEDILVNKLPLQITFFMNCFKIAAVNI
jgi:hypothetical protein